MLEMTETAQILHNATARSLVLVDEIGRGTSAKEGLALATAIARHLIVKNGSFTLFATHYHEIAASPLLQTGANAVQMACTEAEIDADGNVILIPKVKMGGVVKHSFAVPVASLAGLPDSVIKDARTFLSET
jgi:DNA mismatch repair protein MutS